MKKKVYIIHGWDGSPQEPLHRWLKKELEGRGFRVKVPEMPNSARPEIGAWVGKLNDLIKNPDQETYFIGHSIGCQAILRYLEQIKGDKKIVGVVFMAPWMHLDNNTIQEEGEEVVSIAKPWMETPINWGKVREHLNKSVCILSDNDPYVPISNGDVFQKEIQAKIIIESNKGHFTEDEVEELPSALESFLSISG